MAWRRKHGGWIFVVWIIALVARLNVAVTERCARTRVAFLGAALIAVGSGAPAAAQTLGKWFEKNTYMIGPRFDSQVPACANSWALWTITRRFATKERRFWNSDLTITDFVRIREVVFRPWVDGTIPRRFCTGRAQTSDGQWRKLRYSIVEDGGMIGGSWGVQWCVVGVDRGWAYNPDCKSAGP
jgi:hypothetical protein